MNIVRRATISTKNNKWVVDVADFMEHPVLALKPQLSRWEVAGWAFSSPLLSCLQRL
jgi:hypothetical protein